MNTLPPSHSPTTLIDAKTLAERLSISEAQLYKMARDRRIPSYAFGRKCRRFCSQEVNAALARLRVAERAEDPTSPPPRGS